MEIILREGSDTDKFFIKVDAHPAWRGGYNVTLWKGKYCYWHPAEDHSPALDEELSAFGLSLAILTTWTATDSGAVAYRDSHAAEVRSAPVISASATRATRNAALKAAGFRWNKYDADRDSHWDSVQSMNDGDWYLTGPDGKIWNEAAAMDFLTSGKTIEAFRAETKAAQLAESTAQTNEVAGLVMARDGEESTLKNAAEKLERAGKKAVVRNEPQYNRSTGRGYDKWKLYVAPCDVALARETVTDVIGY